MWWTGAALGFDLETDGKDPTDARIITAATVLVTPENPAQEIEVLVQPERDIPDEAAAIHGITTARAREHGGLRETEILGVALTIAELAGPETPLIGHNVSYDLTVVDRELRRLGLGHLARSEDRETPYQVQMTIAGDVIGLFPVIDTLVLDKAVDRYRRGSRKLEAVAEHYGVPMKEGAAHGATADVFASLRIAFKIHQRALSAADYVVRNGPDPMAFQMHPFMRHYGGRKNPLDIVRSFADIGSLGLDQLHLYQVGWAAEQAKGLKEHFVRNPDKGDPDSVDGSWPLRTLTDGASPVETVTTTLV